MALERGDFMRVCAKYPEQRAAMQAVAHSRIASDELRKALPKHMLMQNCTKEATDTITRAFEPFEFSGGELLIT